MTWRNLGVPYHVADNADVRVDGPAAPVLTVAPGVTIRFGRARASAWATTPRARW